MKAVIFAGGVGTRLWPLSRKKHPKQFEKIIGSKSTLQLAANRLLPTISWADIYVSTGKDYVQTIRKQLPLVPPHQVIGEPEMRDVGPAVGLMTAVLAKDSPMEPMVILWSDHLVKKETLFRKIINTAAKQIAKEPEKIIFISQKPRFASENLGWVEHGEKKLTKNSIKFYTFRNFKYRPNKATAQQYFRSHHHAWNLGYFVTTPTYLWHQYQHLAPKLFTGLLPLKNAWGTKSFDRLLQKIYPSLEKIHFDRAILEKLDSSQAYVVSEKIGWSDVGAWEALKESLQKEKGKNVVQGEVLLKDTQDSLIYNYNPKQTLVTIDVDGYIIVNTADVVMVCHQDSVPKIKKLVKSLDGTKNQRLT